MEGKSFRLADEVRHIQRRAADHDSRIVTIGQLVRVPVERDHGFRWKMITQSGGT